MEKIVMCVRLVWRVVGFLKHFFKILIIETFSVYNVDDGAQMFMFALLIVYECLWNLKPPILVIITINNIRESLPFFWFRYHPVLLPFLQNHGTLYALQVTFSTVML